MKTMKTNSKNQKISCEIKTECGSVLFSHSSNEVFDVAESLVVPPEYAPHLLEWLRHEQSENEIGGVWMGSQEDSEYDKWPNLQAFLSGRGVPAGVVSDWARTCAGWDGAVHLGTDYEEAVYLRKDIVEVSAELTSLLKQEFESRVSGWFKAACSRVGGRIFNTKPEDVGKLFQQGYPGSYAQAYREARGWTIPEYPRIIASSDFYSSFPKTKEAKKLFRSMAAKAVAGKAKAEHTFNYYCRTKGLW